MDELIPGVCRESIGLKRCAELVGALSLCVYYFCPSTPEQESEERKCNYERYRGLVQNDFASSKSSLIFRALSTFLLL